MLFLQALFVLLLLFCILLSVSLWLNRHEHADTCTRGVARHSMPQHRASSSHQAFSGGQANCSALGVSMRAAHASACAHVHTLRALGATDRELSALFSRGVLEAARAHTH